MLKNARKRLNLSQDALERISGVSQSYICKLEKTEAMHSPTVKQIIALATSLNISPYDLCCWFIAKEYKSAARKKYDGSNRINKSFVLTKNNVI